MNLELRSEIIRKLDSEFIFLHCRIIDATPDDDHLRRIKAWDMSFLHQDTQVFIKISNVYRSLKDQMKLDLCICEALSYTHVTIETAFVGLTINYH